MSPRNQKGKHPEHLFFFTFNPSTLKTKTSKLSLRNRYRNSDAKMDVLTQTVKMMNRKKKRTSTKVGGFRLGGLGWTQNTQRDTDLKEFGARRFGDTWWKIPWWSLVWRGPLRIGLLGPTHPFQIAWMAHEWGVILTTYWDDPPSNQQQQHPFPFCCLGMAASFWLVFHRLSFWGK